MALPAPADPDPVVPPAEPGPSDASRDCDAFLRASIRSSSNTPGVPHHPRLRATRRRSSSGPRTVNDPSAPRWSRADRSGSRFARPAQRGASFPQANGGRILTAQKLRKKPTTVQGGEDRGRRERRARPPLGSRSFGYPPGGGELGTRGEVVRLRHRAGNAVTSSFALMVAASKMFYFAGAARCRIARQEGRRTQGHRRRKGGCAAERHHSNSNQPPHHRRHAR